MQTMTDGGEGKGMLVLSDTVFTYIFEEANGDNF